MEQDVGRLEVIVDDLALLFVEVTQPSKHLHDDASCFPLCQSPMHKLSML